MGCAKGGIRGVQGVTFTGQLENEGSNNSLRFSLNRLDKNTF